MEAQSYVKSTCAHCGGHIEAPAEGAGMWISCPHCGQKTQLNTAPSTPTKKSRLPLWILASALALIGVATALAVLHRPKRTAPVQTTVASEKSPAAKPAAQPDLWNGLKPGAVTLENSPKSRLIYAIGTIRNDTDKQRFGVKVTLDVLDNKGEKLGTTTDYAQFIDAHKDWSFKALVAFPKASTAKISGITEE